jgi:hypothetical protein
MRRISPLLFITTLTVACLQAQVSTPTISSLQASPNPSVAPLGPAVTAGTGLRNFILYINGSFNVDLFDHVEWVNSVTGVTADFYIGSGVASSGSPNQIVVTIPASTEGGSLFGTPVTAPQAVSITVFEIVPSFGVAASPNTFFPNAFTISNAATLTLNPLLAPPSPTVFPAGTTGQSYSTTLFSGGTPPYAVNYASTSAGTVPPGLNLANSQTLAGTPTQSGLYTFTLQVTDPWNSTLNPTETIEIVDPPTITSVTPNSAAAGSNDVPIVVTGTKFVSPTSNLSSNYKGTTIYLSLGANLTPFQIPTTVVNATTATATIPAAYLTTPRQISIYVVQPSNAQSNSVPFTVFGPAITAVSPTSVTARPTPVALTVTGTGFLAAGSAAPGLSTILVNGTAVSTTVGSSTSLSSSVVFATPGSIPVQVENPGGALSNTANVTVLPAPTITSVTPNPFPGGTLTVNGTNFSNTMTLLFNGTAVSTSFVNAGQLTGTVPTTAIVGTTAQVAVQTADNYITPPVTINLGTPVKITTTFIPGAILTQPYDAKLAATGGTLPYTWSATGLPQGLAINPSTGEITGTPIAFNGPNINVTVKDVNGLTATAQFPIVSTATISAISPNSAPAGSNDLPITVTGTNFASPTSTAGGTVIAISIGGATTTPVPLATTVVSATSATATIPNSYLSTPQQFSILVLQPNSAPSNSLPFTVQAPAITAVAPSPVTARPTPILVTVTGSAFLASGSAAPAQSTILVNGASVSTTFVSSTSLTTSVTLSTPGNIPFQVQNPAGTTSNTVNISVLPAPAITSVTPNPFPGGRLTVSGVNFTGTMTVLFNGIAIPTTFVSAGQLTGAVAGSMIVGATAQVAVQTTDNYITPAVRINLGTPVQITTTSIPAATGLQPYDAKLAATGGTPPYTWSAGGLPQGLSINSATGEITGTPTSFGTFNISVTVTDVNGLNASARYSTPVSTPAPAPQVGSSAPPTGFVNVSYNFTFTATGGNGNVTFGLGSGTVPPGLSLDNSGVLRGQPTTAGSYTFSVTVTDADGLSSSASFTVVIKPQPLSITTPAPLASVPLGSPISIKFAALGGVPPYTFSSTGTLPPGTGLAADGTLSGTPTTPGTYGFGIVVNDSVQSQPGSRSFSLTVTGAALTVTATLGNGQVGAAYTGQVGATGGTPPYTFAVSGLPDGLSFANGTVSGTPTTAGQSTVSVTVTDAAKVTATQSFPITITAQGLTITTASLPDGTVNVAYSAGLAATGGSGKYSFAVSGLPDGLSASSAGAITGTPTKAGTFSVTATVTDTGVSSAVVTASKTFSLIVATAPLSITSTSLPNPTAGTAYSATVAATGGVPPYTFSATGLPAGLSISSSGAISGTTTVPGSASVSVTVKDSGGTTTSSSFQLNVALPPAPALNVTGLPATSTPATQSTITIGIGTTFPVDVTVILTLTFTADSGPDDPTVQFSTGGRTVQLTIPAGSTTASSTVGVQTGTVAGTVTITARLVAGTTDITPSPAPTRTVRINSVPPVVTSVTATATSTGFTVTVIGFATSRSMTQAVFTFTPASGVNLQTTSVTVPASSLFATWYSSSAAAAFGSQFSFTQPFTVSGGTSAVASVSVVLTNADGSSAPVSGTVH